MSDTIPADAAANDEIVVAGKSANRDPNELTLSIGGTEFGGWEEVEVTLRAEGFPNSYDIKASVPPGYKLAGKEGDDCVILLGNDTVITGYVDRITDGGDRDSHTIRIQGRGKTQDLVDCGAEWPSHQMIGGNAKTIAENLCLPYSIAVVMENGASPGPDVPMWPLNYGETAADIIQRVARNAGLLAYENHEGKLALAAVGSVEAASGIKYGENVEEWSAERSMDQRFSEYVCSLLSMDPLMEVPGGNFFGTEKDTEVPRHRRMYLVADAVAENVEEFVQKRAKWEAARRAGRSYTVRAMVDSWRDSAGKLWTPNTLLPVALPPIAGENLVISEVAFRRTNEHGTTAEIVAMPKGAFTPEPIVLSPISFAESVPPPEAGQ